jgi:predicted DNA-binding transcriptional regulator
MVKFMVKDQLLGAVIVIGAFVVIGIYGWLMYVGLSWWVFFIVATIAVVGVMGIMAWIGWTMATTPAPQPIESLDETMKSEEKKE